MTRRYRNRSAGGWRCTGPVRALQTWPTGDAAGNSTQPEWTEGGVIARTVGRLYAQSAGGGLGACTATVVGANTVITAAHCVRTSDGAGSSRSATWDHQLYFVPGYHDGKSPPYGASRCAECGWPRSGRTRASTLPCWR